MSGVAAQATGRRRWPTLLLALGVLLGLVGAFLIGRTSTGPSSAEHAAAQPGATDVGFCQDMGTHHDQAVLMANLAGGRAGPAVTALANSILVGQSQELGVLRGWLQLWGEPVESSTPMVWMSGGRSAHAAMSDSAHMSMQPDSVMPGMASPDELTSLWARSGNEFDIMFLRLMIRHHQGGVDMARYAAGNAKLQLVRQLAETTLYQQVEEIGQMQALLTTYGAAPLPPP
jgi:uncharacterized protein (DUF305 family)